MDTLVLNADYTPMAFIDWQRAMVLFYEGKVNIVENYPDRTVHSAQAEYPVPCVVQFKKFTSKRKRVIKFSRENIWLRDRGSCQYCGVFVDRQKYTYDHVKPRTKGGKTEWTNIVCCCYACNQKKAGRTPAQAGMVLSRKPVKPTELPIDLMQTIEWKPGMPSSWTSWLFRSIPVFK